VRVLRRAGARITMPVIVTGFALAYIAICAIGSLR
jgi:hypothetical protein